jgi:SAM-dependent methyltransferase
MRRKTLHPTPGYQQISDDLWGGWRAQTLVAGIELDLFTHIAAGKRKVGEIADAAQASERGVVRLLDALVGLGYLEKNRKQYRLRPVAEQFLVRGREFYLGGVARTTRLHWNTWAQLTEAVRTGRPVVRADAEPTGQEFFSNLVPGLFPRSLLAARAAVRSLPKETRARCRRILDVAAGSAAWSIAFAERLPDARVTIVDYPQVTPIARQFAERYGVGDRFEYREGNLRVVDFGLDYDLVILGHIIHSEGPAWGRKLLEKSYGALRRGGLLLIAEMIPNEERSGPPLPLLFSLNMLLHTEEGDVFTLQEYRRWLKQIGFQSTTTLTVPAPSPLILAKK